MSVLQKLQDRRRFAWQTYWLTTCVYWLFASLLILPTMFFSKEGWKWDVAIGLVTFIAVVFLFCNLLTCAGRLNRIDRFTEFEYEKFGQVSDYDSGHDLWKAVVDYEKVELGKDYGY